MSDINAIDEPDDYDPRGVVVIPHGREVINLSGPVDDMLARSEFRGLWRSRCLEGDGSLTSGWSITFVHDGEYYDVPYQDTPAAACRYGLDRLAELG